MHTGGEAGEAGMKGGMIHTNADANGGASGRERLEKQIQMELCKG